MSLPRAAPASRWRRLLTLGGMAIAVLGAGHAASLVTGLFDAASSAAGHDRPHAARLVKTGRISSRPQRSVKPSVGSIGTYAVAELPLSFVDWSAAGGNDTTSRLLPTLVRYPVFPGTDPGAGTSAPGPFPLVVFAPGYLQCGRYYSHLLNAWASAGYVVAAVKFPGTNCDVGDGDEDDVVNQPAEVSYVIGKLVAMSARSDGVMSGLVDPGEVAVAGHSDGGDTVAAVAANTCCLDHRVVGAVVMAGGVWPPLGGSYFQSATPPMLFVQGDADPVHPPAATLEMYQADTTGPHYYLDVLGAGHFSPYEGDGPQEQLVARVTLAFLDRYVAGQRQARATMLRSGNVSGAALVGRGMLPPS